MDDKEPALKKGLKFTIPIHDMGKVGYHFDLEMVDTFLKPEKQFILISKKYDEPLVEQV